MFDVMQVQVPRTTGWEKSFASCRQDCIPDWQHATGKQRRKSDFNRNYATAASPENTQAEVICGMRG